MTSFSYHSLLLSPINNSSSQFYDATETPSTGVEHVTQNVKRKMRIGTTLDSAQATEQETGRKRKQKKSNESMENEKKEKEAPTEYIHVRARRGQATDSHSLAERVRREKISERMKILQSLVPGCDKVSGKALMLDEIINYVQSLQNQVEFLSMKLASINPMFYEFGVDLDASMVKPESLMNSVPSPPLQQCSPLHPTLAPPLLDASASFFLQQGGQWPSQDNGGLLWDSGCFH